MLSLLAERLAEAYRSPRKSARRILAAEPSVGQSLTMAAAGYALLELLARTMQLALGVSTAEVILSLSQASQEDIRAAVTAGKGVESLARNFIWHMLEAVTAALLAFMFGRAAGGKAGFRDLLGLAGWWTLVSMPVLAAAQFALLISAPGGAAFGMLAMILGGLYIFYLLASFLAEAHGFESVAPVFIAVLCVTFAATLVFAALTSA